MSDPKKLVDFDDLWNLLDLRQQGKTIRELAEFFHCGPMTIFRRLDALALPHPQGRWLKKKRSWNEDPERWRLSMPW